MFTLTLNDYYELCRTAGGDFSFVAGNDFAPFYGYMSYSFDWCDYISARHYPMNVR